MLLYEYEIRTKLERTKQALGAIAPLVNATGPTENEAPISENEYNILYPVALGAESMCKELLEALPPEVVRGNRLIDHCGWILYWTGHHDRTWTRSNYLDTQFDISALERAFVEWCGACAHFDGELRNEIKSLLAQRQLDSAVRKSFVILKERLVDMCCALGEPRSAVVEMDGDSLVNHIFGASGSAVARMSEKAAEREAMRNLLAGLYGVFRNIVDHHDVEVPWHEAEAVIGMVNWTLLRLSAMASEWKLQEGAPRSQSTN